MDKKRHTGWIIVAAIVIVALVWYGISAAISASRRNKAPLPAKVTSNISTQGIQYRYDKDTRFLYVSGNTQSFKWLIPFIDTSTPLGVQQATLASSGNNIASIMVFYILSSSPTVSSGKVKKVELDLGSGQRTDYYFLTRGGKTTRINAFKVSYDDGQITSIGDRAFGYNKDGLLQKVGTVLTIQFAGNTRMSGMKLEDTATTSQYSYKYQYVGKNVNIAYSGNNTLLNTKESGTILLTLGKSTAESLTSNGVKYEFEITR